MLRPLATLCLALSGGLVLSGGPALAQQATDGTKAEPFCEVADQSEVIRVAICTREGTDEELATFGRAACDGILPCGVWFWTSAADAPTTAPDNHDGLSQAEVTSSQGVFVAEDNAVIRIGKTTN
ncbi:MAG: hypothetical protein WBA25_18200 [Jannaschia sp.]